MYLSFPGSSADKESACNVGDPPVHFLGQEDLLEKGQATYASILGLLCGGSAGKESACNAEDLGLISGYSIGNYLQYPVVNHNGKAY